MSFIPAWRPSRFSRSLSTMPRARRARPSIDIGTRVQSIPGPGEKPQTFETIEKIPARVEWNALKPRMSRVSMPKFGTKSVYLKGIATNLKPGDALLLVGQEREQMTRQRAMGFSPDCQSRPSTPKEIARASNGPRVWERPSPHQVLPAAEPKFYALRQRAALFGANAPHPATLSDQTLAHYGQAASADWPFSISGQTIDLDTTYPAIVQQ